MTEPNADLRAYDDIGVRGRHRLAMAVGEAARRGWTRPRPSWWVAPGRVFAPVHPSPAGFVVADGEDWGNVACVVPIESVAVALALGVDARARGRR